jgi:hypothetical protein
MQQDTDPWNWLVLYPWHLFRTQDTDPSVAEYLFTGSQHHDRVFPLFSRNATELTQAADLCIMFAQYFGQIFFIYNISTPTVRGMKKSVGHSHGSLAPLYIHDCRWWSETLWETLIRLWLQAFVMLPWTIELLLWRFLCNFIDMILCRVSDLGWLGVWSLEC